MPIKEEFMESMVTNGKPKLTGLKVLVIDDSKTIRRAPCIANKLKCSGKTQMGATQIQ